MIDIAARRLQAHGLIGEPLQSATDVVRLLGAVQAQDYAGAKWALGQRTAGTTNAEIDTLFDEGRILRTHVMRPTWHFVLPEDIRWLLELTGPRVHHSLAGRYRQLGITGDDETRAVSVIRGALDGRYLTRPELGEVLRTAGIATDGQRLPHFLMAAELTGAIVSGPRRGKEFTYALLAERVPESATFDRPDALARLVIRYFHSHGPAQLQDFVWWSGLTVSDARTGLTHAAPDLEHRTIEGRDYWFHPATGLVEPAVPVAHLLPNWDEYTVGYRDRSAALPTDHALDLSTMSFGSILSNVVTMAGRVRGSWRRIVGREHVRIEVRVQGRVTDVEAAAVDRAARRFGVFLGMPIEVVYL